MQHSDKTVLCRSRYGALSVFNNAVAFELTFKKIITILDSEKIHQLGELIRGIEDVDFINTGEQKFVFIRFPHLEGNYILTDEEVRDLCKLLLEATAMIKVHHRLYFKYSSRIN